MNGPESSPFDMSHCTLCPRRCGVDRGVKEGFCGIGLAPVVAKAFPHFWEEPCISGSRGSGTVFFTGCSLRCDFCQNRPISREGIGWEMDAERLSHVFLQLAAKGVHNLNLVNPTHQAHAIHAALARCGADLAIPVVWNSGGYDAVGTIEAMAPHIAVWLPDLKFHDTELSRMLAAAPDYFDRATEAIRAMVRLAGPPVYDGDGMLVRGVLIRHLVLPGHTRDAIRILEWIAAEFGNAVPVSLMGQYTPMPEAVAAPDRRLRRREYERVVEALFRLGLEEGYVQELSASGREHIPDWDGEGLED